jgi:membrane protein insertase Oxa1/YidC/SpoIIIJ
MIECNHVCQCQIPIRVGTWTCQVSVLQRLQKSIQIYDYEASFLTKRHHVTDKSYTFSILTMHGTLIPSVITQQKLKKTCSLVTKQNHNIQITRYIFPLFFFLGLLYKEQNEQNPSFQKH